MQAIAVRPGTPHSVHLATLPRPSLATIPNDRGVLVKVLQVGVDATDQEINEALYGNPPAGSDFLVIGHEVFGRVVEVGSAVTHVVPGDYVSCTVRRPGGSLFDAIGRSDVTSEREYFERGINLRHGFLTEYFVDDAEFIVKVPPKIKHIGVLAEPASVCAKAIEQALLAQQRLQVWRPRVAWVMGAGQIGLLSSMMLRLMDLQVYTIARGKAAGNIKAEIAAEFGAHYVSSAETSLDQLAAQSGPPDLVIEATGNSGIAFECMQHLNLNGALVLTSITGGNRVVEVAADKLNLHWVLGNKLMLGSVNGNAGHFRKGVADLAHGEMMFPDTISRILTHKVVGLENFAELMRLLEDRSVLKVYLQVAEDT